MVVVAPPDVAQELREEVGSLTPEQIGQLTPQEAASLAALFSEPQDFLSWTEQHRTINGKALRPSELPWLRDLYQCDARRVWVMKAAQVFQSELMVGKALHAADTRRGGRGNVLYVFPTQSQMDDFAQARVDKAIEESRYLSARLGEAIAATGKSSVARVRLKRIGGGHLYLRGADRRTQIISVDADLVLCDEVDEFKEVTIATLEERLGSAVEPGIWGASTPKFPGSGIAPIWQDTTRSRYHLKCPACNHWQHLIFPDNITEGGVVICAKCRGPLDTTSEGEWVGEREAESLGFHVSQLYSPRSDLAGVAKRGYGILNGLIVNNAQIEEFWRQAMGLAYAPKGGALTDSVLQPCEADYAHPTAAPKDGIVVMGMDVGNVKNIVIKATNDLPGQKEGATKLLFAGTVSTWEQAGELFTRYGVTCAVVDAHPEDAAAAEFAASRRGRVFRCFYPNMTNWKHKETCLWNATEYIVQAHRTRLLDDTFARFYQNLEVLPRGSEKTIPGLWAQLKAPVRVTSKNADGQEIGLYDEGSAADHYSHAYAYATAAWERAQYIWALSQPLQHGSMTFNSGTHSSVLGQKQDKDPVLGSKRKPLFANETGVNPFAGAKEKQDQAATLAELNADFAAKLQRLNGDASGNGGVR